MVPWDEGPLPCRRFVPDGQAPYQVVVLNDDGHSLEYVIGVLVAAVGYTGEEAARLATAVHHRSRAVVAVAGPAVAGAIRDRIMAAGPDPRVRGSAGPMGWVVRRQEVSVFYAVSKDSRWFKPQVLYNQVDWANLDAIVDSFADRVSEWYVKPAEALQAASGHFAFGAMALNCILIDTLSQFHAGSVASSRNVFKKFVREWFPDFRPNLPTPIAHFDASKAKNNVMQMVDFADVLYHAFRCGIVHEAHVAPYGMVRGGATVVEFQPAGYTKYAATGADCPTVLLDPWLLLGQVKSALAGYVANLKNRDPKFDQLRQRFKHKFTESFGVDISGTT